MALGYENGKDYFLKPAAGQASSEKPTIGLPPAPSSVMLNGPLSEGTTTITSQLNRSQHRLVPLILQVLGAQAVWGGAQSPLDRQLMLFLWDQSKRL